MEKLLVLGSSIFEQYQRVGDLVPEYVVANCSLGGTTSEYWARTIEKILVRENPNVVMLYCGSNDLNGNTPDADIIAHVAQCSNYVHAIMPKVKYCYFGIMKAPQKTGNWERIHVINEAIKAKMKIGDLFIDPNDIIFKESAPRGHCFLDDGLHITQNGYAEITAYAKPIIQDWLQRLHVS